MTVTKGEPRARGLTSLGPARGDRVSSTRSGPLAPRDLWRVSNPSGKLAHLGATAPADSTLAYADARRPSSPFEQVSCQLWERCHQRLVREVLSVDPQPGRPQPKSSHQQLPFAECSRASSNRATVSSRVIARRLSGPQPPEQPLQCHTKYSIPTPTGPSPSLVRDIWHLSSL